jgi:hypothetical protein
MGGAAGRFRRASLEKIVETACVLSQNPGIVAVDGKTESRMTLRMASGCSRMSVCARKAPYEVPPIHIPRGIAEYLAEVGEIGGALSRIVGAKVGAGGGEFAVAGLRRGQMGRAWVASE